MGTLADEHESDVDFSELPLEERFRELWRLSQAGHALSGRPFPTYRRSEMPGRLLSLQDDV
ncbi:MAG: hypothetical protein ACKVPX_14395 [Myxococcaceae bacterium]